MFPNIFALWRCIVLYKFAEKICNTLSPGGGGGALPSNRLMGMCRLIGLHCHDWIDYNGVAFSSE